MPKYKCKKCGYTGNRLIFQFDDYTYCVATNDEDSEYINKIPKWVENKVFTDTKIGEPVGCPKCHSWGVNNFEMIS